MNGLPALAENLAARGRNGDSMLVHMTPGEVKGLQALALSQGGSLSINPDTGLVEANFLKRLLPMIAGAALTIGSGGVINPYMAGAIVGGVEGIRTGDLSKGLMAGLGGFGGAGLGAGLSAAGATASGASGASTAAQQIAAQPAASMAAANLPANVAPTIGQNLMQGMQGIGALGTEAGRTAFMGSPAVAANAAQGVTGTAATGVGGGMGLAKYGMSAAMPLMQPEPMTFPTPEDPYANYEGPYTPSARQVSYPDEDFRRRRTSEFTYFTPSNPMPFQDGGDVISSMNVTPAEADVYRNIANVQRMAGIPSIANMPLTVAPQRDMSSLVYNPVQYVPSETPRGEQNYGFAPLITKEEAEKNVAASLIRNDGFGGFLDSSDQEIIGYTDSNQPIYRSPRPFMGYKNGGVPMLEDGGFVLTKQAVDGLGSGDNKEGQKVASRGLGAIPIKGPGHGTSDSIRTTIEGKQPALVSNGEAYVPKKQVEKNGGAKKFYALMRAAERRA